MSDTTLTRRVSDLEIRQMEQGTTLWGDDKTRSNGLRSKVRCHETRIDEIEPIARNAKADIAAHLEEHAKMEEATNILKTAAMQVRGAVIASGISALAAIAVAIISAVAK